MPVYFAYRCAYANPSGKHVVRFDDDTVLAWFQRHWAHLCHVEESDARLEALLGIDVYGLESLFRHAAEHNLPAPASGAALQRYLDEHLYAEGSIVYSPHAIQVLTDDDEISLPYFFFDGHFLARHGERAAFLLTEGWRLPGGAGKGGFRASIPTEPLRLPGGKGEGTVYVR